MAFVAAAIIGSGIIGAGASIFGTSKAVDAQQAAAQAAQAEQAREFNVIQADYAPYKSAGNDALTKLQDNNYYTTPITMDEATLEQTPGYQFNLTQGLKAVQNSVAVRGLGNSGAALKGAANFATGLADNTYQNQFNNANTNQTNAYNRLAGIVGIGENAAAGVGNAAGNVASSNQASIIGAGNATAAGANATAGAVTNAANNIGGYYAYKGLYGNGSGGSSADSYGGGSPYSGDAYGGSAAAPLPGLTSADYG